MSVFFMNFDMAPSVIWARDLYDQMQIRSDFRKWFPRMCQYGFVEGRDYEFVPRVRPQDEGGRTVQRYVKDYRITLEMAKQLYKLHHFHKNDCFRWVLYAKHQDKGYTANLVFRLHRSDGSAVEKLHTAWTHKGRKFLYHELKRRGILPMAEQEG